MELFGCNCRSCRVREMGFRFTSVFDQVSEADFVIYMIMSRVGCGEIRYQRTCHPARSVRSEFTRQSAILIEQAADRDCDSEQLPRGRGHLFTCFFVPVIPGAREQSAPVPYVNARSRPGIFIIKSLCITKHSRWVGECLGTYAREKGIARVSAFKIPRLRNYCTKFTTSQRTYIIFRRIYGARAAVMDYSLPAGSTHSGIKCTEIRLRDCVFVL